MSNGYGGSPKTSPKTSAKNTPQCSPGLGALAQPNIDLSGLDGSPGRPRANSDMTPEAMTLLLPGLKRMRRDATTPEERKKLTEEIDDFEKKLGIAEKAPQPQKCLISSKADRELESTESRSERTTSGGDAESNKMEYAAIMLPGLLRMRQSAASEEREKLNKEIAELEETLGINTPFDMRRFELERQEKGDGANGKVEPSSDAKQEVGAVVPGESGEMSVELMGLLLPGLRRMHRDATCTEERTSLTEEIDAMEAKLQKAGVNPGAIRRIGADQDTQKSKDFAILMLPGLRRMRHSGSAEDKARVDKEIAELEGRIGVAPAASCAGAASKQ